MHVYAPPSKAHLWRETTEAIAGRGCAPAPFRVNGKIAVCVRTYSSPSITSEARRRAGLPPSTGRSFADMQTPASATIELQGVQLVALVEDPLVRLRKVWFYRSSSPAFTARCPLRFRDVSGKAFGDFIRWVLAQDPLACDELIRPQWAMLPAGCLLYRAQCEADIEEPSALTRDIVRALYADDLALWESAKDLACWQETTPQP